MFSGAWYRRVTHGSPLKTLRSGDLRKLLQVQLDVGKFGRWIKSTVAMIEWFYCSDSEEVERQVEAPDLESSAEASPATSRPCWDLHRTATVANDPPMDVLLRMIDTVASECGAQGVAL